MAPDEVDDIQEEVFMQIDECDLELYVDDALPLDFSWSHYADSRLQQYEAAMTDPQPGEACYEAHEVPGAKYSGLIFVAAE